MIFFILFLCFICAFSFVLGFLGFPAERRPTLQATFGFQETTIKKKKKNLLASLLQIIASFNRPLCAGPVRQYLVKDLNIAHVNLTPEEFFLVREITIVLIMFFTYSMIQPDMIVFWVLMSVGTGYMLPTYWLKGKIKKIKGAIVRELPDAIDLLGLCVNAGLDFMLALKWVVEKSPPSVIVGELNILLQEINVGKTRRDALKDLAAKYDLPDVATFTRTLIQADKMGTSVSEALNILSEDMRLARFRRGEQMAMKAPMKMLVPLLMFIFPVVLILVAGPIFLDFIENNPMASLGGR